MPNPSHHGDKAGQLAGAISSLIESGLPIEQGLRAAALDLPRGRTARALSALADRLDRGEQLDKALEDDQRLPAHLSALIAAGVRSASLGRVLEELVAAERHAYDVHRGIVLALSYPALLLALMSCVFALFTFAVVPNIVEIYEDFDLNIPLQTQEIAEISRSGQWMLLGNIAVFVSGWLLVWIAMRVAELRALLLAVPLLGPVIRWAALARFSRLLALLIEMDLPTPQAVQLAGRGCHDVSLRHAARRAAASLQAGAALSDALAALRQFPESLRPMIRWGEQPSSARSPSASLAVALGAAAEMFEDRLEAQLGLLRAVTPPLCFLFVMWGLMYLISSAMLPAIDLIDKLT